MGVLEWLGLKKKKEEPKQYYGPAFGPSGEAYQGGPARNVQTVAAGGARARYNPNFGAITADNPQGLAPKENFIQRFAGAIENAASNFETSPTNTLKGAGDALYKGTLYSIFRPTKAGESNEQLDALNSGYGYGSEEYKKATEATNERLKAQGVITKNDPLHTVLLPSVETGINLSPFKAAKATVSAGNIAKNAALFGGTAAAAEIPGTYARDDQANLVRNVGEQAVAGALVGGLGTAAVGGVKAGAGKVFSRGEVTPPAPTARVKETAPAPVKPTAAQPPASVAKTIREAAPAAVPEAQAKVRPLDASTGQQQAGPAVLPEKPAVTPETPKGAPDVYYHTTTPEAAASIREQGFVPQVGERSQGATQGVGTFFYKNDEDAAKVFGENFTRQGKNAEIVPTNIQGKVYNALDDDRSIRSLAEDPQLIDRLRKEGYVGIEGDEMGQPVTFVFDTNAAKPLPAVPARTQKEQVVRALANKEQATAAELAQETAIKEPNIRRILGEDVKSAESVFERVDKGVYRITTKDGKVKAYIETADAMEALPRLANEGMKADMVFLDLPYKLPSVQGGNRGVKYELITPQQYKVITDAAAAMMRTDDSHIYMMINNAPSDKGLSEEFVNAARQSGLKVVSEGKFTKMTNDGLKRATNVRGKPQAPERIILLTKSGAAREAEIPISMDYTLPRVNRKYPTEKPAPLAAGLVRQSTEKGDMVVDPFAGSGVVGDEAVKAGRSAYLLEKSADAVEDVIKPRLAETFRQEYGLKLDTVEKLIERHGPDKTVDFLRARGEGIKSARNPDGFAIAEAGKQFGGRQAGRATPPKSEAPTQLPVKEPPKTAGGEVLGEGRFAPVPVETGFATQLKTAFVDRDAPVIKVLKDLEKQSGETGFVDEFLYDTGLLSRSNSIANSKLRTDPNLQKALGGMGKNELDDFNAYSAARSELANAERDMTTSKGTDELQMIVDELGPQYKERFDALNEFYKARAKDAYEGGLIDQDTYMDWIANDDYVRIQRNMDDLVARPQGVGNAYSLGSSITKQKRKGSQREVLPADQTAFDYTQQIQKEVQRNQVASNLIDTLELFGMARKLDPKDAVRKNTIKRIVRGETQIYEIDPDIKQVVDNVAPYHLNVLERIIAAPARILRAGTTGLSAPFTIANWVKDQVGSGINSKHVLATHHPKNVAQGLFNATKDQFGTSNNELWQKFIAHAGDTTQYDLTRNVRGGKEVSRALRRGKAGSAANAVLHPIRTLEDINSITERATRFQNFEGIYNDALKRTGSQEEALKEATLAAWQNSVDFNRAGDWARAVNLLVPYFNASIQGTRQLGRSFRDRPVATSMKTIAGVTLPLAGLTAYNMMDPDRKAIYNNISDFEKENNFILIPPGMKPEDQNEDGTYDVYKLPIVLGYGNLAGPTRRMIESFANDNPQDFAGMAGDILKAVSGPLDPRSPEQALASLTPQVVKPTMQQLANKDFFTGKEIVPEYIETDVNPDGTPLKESEKAYKYSSGTARELGDLLGVSPIRVEKFIKDTFGKVGSYSLNTVDTGQAKAGMIPQDQIGGTSAASDIVRRFTKAQGEYNNKKSEGAKYFDDLKAATEGLTPNELAAFNSIHPRGKNIKGEDIDGGNILDPAVKALVYMQNPKIFDVDRNIDKKGRERGEAGNPIFDLNDDQRKRVLIYRSSKILNAGKQNYDKDGNPLFTALNLDEKWYDDFRKKESDFYDNMKLQQDAEQAKSGGGKVALADSGDGGEKTFSGAKRPQVSDDLQNRMDHYFDLPKDQRKAYLAANPDILNQWQRSEDFTDQERAAIGLDPLKDDDYKYGKGGGYGRSGGRRGGGGGGGGRGGRVSAPKASFAKAPMPSTSVRKGKVLVKVAKAGKVSAAPKLGKLV